MRKQYIKVVFTPILYFFIFSGCSSYQQNGFGKAQRMGRDSISGFNYYSYNNDSLKVNLLLSGDHDYYLTNKVKFRLSKKEKADLRKSKKEILSHGRFESLFSGYDWKEKLNIKSKQNDDGRIYTNLFSFFVPVKQAKSKEEWISYGFVSGKKLCLTRETKMDGSFKLEFIIPVRKGFIYYFMLSTNMKPEELASLKRNLQIEKEDMDSLLLKSKF